MFPFRRFQERYASFSPIICGLVILCGIIIGVSGSMNSPLWASAPHIQIQHQPPYFSPTHLNIFSGGPVTWENHTGEPHSIVSDDCSSLSQCSFDSGLIRPRGQFELTRLRPGRYAYHCGIHPFMRGMLTVHAPQSFSSDI